MIVSQKYLFHNFLKVGAILMFRKWKRRCEEWQITRVLVFDFAWILEQHLKYEKNT